MRKLRDYDAELKALDERACLIRARKVKQLGELVIETGADVLSIEQLTGILLTAVGEKDATAKEAWRVRGAAFFPRQRRSKAAPAASTDAGEPASADYAPAVPGGSSAS